MTAPANRQPAGGGIVVSVRVDPRILAAATAALAHRGIRLFAPGETPSYARLVNYLLAAFCDLADPAWEGRDILKSLDALERQGFPTTQAYKRRGTGVRTVRRGIAKIWDRQAAAEEAAMEAEAQRVPPEYSLDPANFMTGEEVAKTLDTTVTGCYDIDGVTEDILKGFQDPPR